MARVVEGPGTSGTIQKPDDSGSSVHAGDRVRIVAPGEPGDGAVGVVLDVLAVLPDDADTPFIVARERVEKTKKDEDD